MSVQPRFSSTTHLHIYAIINTLIEFEFRPKKKTLLRLLDVGCGNGVMLSTLAKELPRRHPNIKFEFYGIDVDDSHVQQEGYFKNTVQLLAETSPETNWQNQLVLLKSDAPWPYPDSHFDMIFSNQVMEHVADQQFFLHEIKRSMDYDGYSFHLYPLKHYIYEGHLKIPFVHKFNSWTTTYHWIRWATFLGFGTFKKHKRLGLTASLNEFAERHADYLAFQVNYKTVREIAATVKSCRLKSSFDFTHLYYLQKLRSVVGLGPMEIYNKTDIRSGKNGFYFFFLKYLTGITLLVRKNDTF